MTIVVNFLPQPMRRFFQKTPPKPKILINDKIPFPSFLVIDQNNKSLGVLSKATALKIAQDANLDLVCINNSEQKPICKIVNYDNYRFNQQKAIKKHKTVNSEKEEKEIRISAGIDNNDLKIKANQCEKFLQKKCRVKITMRLRGREKYIPNYGLNKMEQLLELVNNENISFKKPELKQNSYITFLEIKK